MTANKIGFETKLHEAGLTKRKSAKGNREKRDTKRYEALKGISN